MNKIAGQIVLGFTGIMLIIIGAILLSQGQPIGGAMAIALGSACLMVAIPRKVRSYELTEGEREVARKREAVLLSRRDPPLADRLRQPEDAKLTALAPLTETGVVEGRAAFERDTGVSAEAVDDEIRTAFSDRMSKQP